MKNDSPVRATAYKGRLAKEILSRIGEGDHSILEIGCGDGWLSQELAGRYPSGRVLGVDINENAIRQAKKYANHPNLEFRVCDVAQLGEENAFDYVVSVNSFHHFTEREKTLEVISKVLKRGGKLIVLDFNGDSWFMRVLDALSVDHTGPIKFLRSEELRESMEKAGLKDVSVDLGKITGMFSIMVGTGRRTHQ